MVRYVMRVLTHEMLPAMEEINETDGETETEDGSNIKDKKTSIEHDTGLVKERDHECGPAEREVKRTKRC